MNDMKLRLKYEDYHKATNSLRLAVQWPPDDDNMYLDATIQRFEFCFELSWRLMRSVLAYEGIDVSTPRGSIREGWKLGVIDDAEKWLDMLEKRKLSAHAYNEATTMNIYRCITDEYVDLPHKRRSSANQPALGADFSLLSGKPGRTKSQHKHGNTNCDGIEVRTQNSPQGKEGPDIANTHQHSRPRPLRQRIQGQSQQIHQKDTADIPAEIIQVPGKLVQTHDPPQEHPHAPAVQKRVDQRKGQKDHIDPGKPLTQKFQPAFQIPDGMPVQVVGQAQSGQEQKHIHAAEARVADIPPDLPHSVGIGERRRRKDVEHIDPKRGYAHELAAVLTDDLAGHRQVLPLKIG